MDECWCGVARHTHSAQQEDNSRAGGRGVGGGGWGRWRYRRSSLRQGAHVENCGGRARLFMRINWQEEELTKAALDARAGEWPQEAATMLIQLVLDCTGSYKKRPDSIKDVLRRARAIETECVVVWLSVGGAPAVAASLRRCTISCASLRAHGAAALPRSRMMT